ncbi:YeeE/YedE thiosulfate transporter family protein [Aureliella helgolandensis]|uniref:Putative inner membrane protein n=1 Tax=Aureliella helgolandensis TaxID=2527968 RepID=A0A518GD39_9BACT|nr:YeeE/YedE thiosulfate transporter family protein [Aureliella helgolandensis]QDV26515.1 putative inner membrane protein [Aureliella helgolandensis]
MFDPIWKLALGLFTGVVFGILLQKGAVAKFRVIVGQFILKDWTVVKIMGTAVIVGAVGVYGLLALEVVSLHIRPLAWAGIVVGGVLFGVGMAVFGYCPGTSVAACGEGRRDAMVGVAGMLVAAGVYVVLYPWLHTLSESLGNAGEVTLPDLTGTSPWLWIGVLAILAVLAQFLSRLFHPARTRRDRQQTVRVRKLRLRKQFEKH